MTALPGDPSFEDERAAIWKEHRTPAGRRKLVLPGSKKRAQTVAGLLDVAFRHARMRAKRKSVPFELTEAGLIEHMERIGGRCELSGLEFDPQYDPKAKYAHNPYGVSIDRIVPSVGYVPGNCRLILTSLNFAINQWGLDAYLKVARSVLQRSPF